VVLANGEVVRTGMGALPNSKTWQQNKWGYGPWVDGLFRQGNMGVVTKMGFYLMPRPEAFISANVEVFNREDIIPLVDVLNLLENQHVVNGSTALGGGARFGPPRENAPLWTCFVPIYGPAAVIRAQMDYAKEKFLAAIPTARITETEMLHTPLTAEQLGRVRQVYFGVPNLSTFTMLGRTPVSPGMGGHIGFSPIVSRTGEEILAFHDFYAEHRDAVQQGEELGIVGPVMMTNWERSLVCLIMFPIGRDQALNQKMRGAFERWVALAAERGWAEYRAPAAFQDLVADTYSFNDHALRRLRETIKDAVDPNGILSPGRYGVWPKHIREA
jgi:4-cresol dehydrogenase (hydroxylating)